MRSKTPVTTENIRRMPKVLLHDHLDGGLRPGTVIELADAIGYKALPSGDSEALRRWFRDAADAGSLVSYLETFAHTCGVLQSEDALVRVAAEAVEDLAEDGIVHAEVRYAPELFRERGLSLEGAIEAVSAGFADGERRAARQGRRIRARSVLCAMRQHESAREIAALVVRYRDAGVAGFDIAGPEAGYPPSRFLESFQFLDTNNAHFTIHAGEAAGVASIAEAIHVCGAKRIGHGVRLADDITLSGGEVHLGRLAAHVRDAGIPLELCPSSNVQTGAAPSIAAHPFGLLARAGLRVTVNTDNRLMSGCTLTSEFAALSEAFGYTMDDLRRFTIDAAESAFLDPDERRELLDLLSP
ncbi:adenosine deaminase [Amycolatopsis sp. cg5]|uniref:adenosine deaminase n=1 Tax=Amycolatopsis sp. cg5 TaxID=3238802 RepID=UPI0035251AD9